MSETTKEKWISRAVYILLALLLIAVLTITVIAIVSTVSARRNDTLPVSGEPDTETGGDNVDNVPSGGNGEAQETTAEPVYLAPCNGYLMKDFSEDVLVFSSTMNDYRIHLGVDIAGKTGDPVVAFSDGKIEKIFSDPFMGKSIIIDHGNGLKSRYMNLSDTLPEGIAAGAEVKPGTVIGSIGETAISECADTPHLHFELWLGGKRVDPAAYITIPDAAETVADYEG